VFTYSAGRNGTADRGDSVVSVTADPRAWFSAKRQELMPAGSLRARFTLGVFWSLAGAVISRGFTLGASIVCARFLGKTGFGELGMIQSTVGTFGIFAGLGLGLTATKYVAELREQDPVRVGRILALSAVAALISGVLMTTVLVVMAPVLARNVFGAPNLAGPLAIGAGLVFFGALNGAQTGALAGFEAFQTIARVNVFAGLTSFPLIVFGVWRWGIRGAVWGTVAAMAINWALNNRALRREGKSSGIAYEFAGFYKEWRVLHRFTLPAFLASIVVGPAMWICNTLLVHQPEGYAQLGLYTAADRWRLLILFVPTSVFGMVVPVLSNLYGAGDLLGFKRVFRANVLLNSGLALTLALVVFAFAPRIMAVFGKTFHSGWPILAILAFSALPEALNTVLGHPLIVADAMWWRCGFDLLLAALLVGSAIVFIPRWGAIGLALAYFLAFSGASVGLYLFGNYEAGRRITKRIPIREQR
jgi:O-antigen/teichoic acid export membrane protein